MVSPGDKKRRTPSRRQINLYRTFLDCLLLSVITRFPSPVPQLNNIIEATRWRTYLMDSQ